MEEYAFDMEKKNMPGWARSKVFILWHTLPICTLGEQLTVECIHSMNVLNVHWVVLDALEIILFTIVLLFFLHFPGPSNHSCLCYGPQRSAYPSSRWPVWSWIRPHHKLRCQHSGSGRSAEECSRGCSIWRIHRLRGASGLPRHGLPAAHPRCLPDILILGADHVKQRQSYPACDWTTTTTSQQCAVCPIIQKRHLNLWTSKSSKGMSFEANI